MNGKKILNKLIVIFILLNMLLFSTNVFKTIKSYRLDETRINNVIYALKQKEIYLETTLPRFFSPKRVGSLDKLIGSGTTVERYDIVKALFGNNNVIITKDINEIDSFTYKFGNEALEFHKNMIIYTNNRIEHQEVLPITIEDGKNICSDFIRRLGYTSVFEDAYIEYNQKNNVLQMTFYAKYEKLPIFDIYISFEIVDDEIQTATMKLGQISQLEENKNKKEIYPIDLILFGIDDELNIEKPIYITDITLGYKAVEERNISLLGAQIIPVYKIYIKGLNSPIYVNAYTNQRIE